MRTWDSESRTWDQATEAWDSIDTGSMDRILLETGDVLLLEDGSGGFGLEGGHGQSATLAQGVALVAVTIALIGSAIAVSQGAVSANSNGSVALTGTEITSAQQTIAPSWSQALTGSASTPAAGTLTLIINPSTSAGQAITTGSGTVSASGNSVTVNITGSESTFAQGNVQGGFAFLSGAESTSAAGTAVPSLTVAITGSESACAQGSVGPAQDADDTLITGGIGNTAPAMSLALIGAEIATAQGALTVTGDITLALTGEESTSDTGTVSPDPFFDITGLQITSQQETLGAPGTAALTGSEITVTTGVVFTTEDRDVALTGAQMTAVDGITFASSLAFPTGLGIESLAQSIGPRGADLVGESISANQGFVEAPRRSKDAGSIVVAAKEKAKVIVEIDGQQFQVRNRKEAEELLAVALQVAEEKASEELAKAAASKQSRSKLVRVVRHKLQEPVVSVEGDDADVQQSVEEFQSKVKNLYDDAVRSAEIGVLLRKKQEQEEDDFMVGLLL